MNILKAIIVIVFVGAYYKFIAPHVPSQFAISLNLWIIPLLAGAFIWVLTEGDCYYDRFVIAFPLVALLVATFYYGGDPAVPDLQYLVAGFLAIMYMFGLFVGYGITKLSRL